MKTKLSDYVIQFIVDAGVKHVFMVPGGGAMHLNDSLGRNASVTWVGNLHEQASAMCAEAYSKATNHLGAALVTTGPGGTNTITGVAGAWLDSTPCLFVSGQVKRADLTKDSGVRQVGVQEVDIVSIVKSITKYSITVLEPESIRYHMEKALHLALTGRPGPVWIDIPLDVQASLIDVESLSRFDPAEDSGTGGGPSLGEQVADAIRLLERSERPVLLVGNGCRRARHEFRALVEALRIPVLTTWLALDLIPDAHALFAGRPGAVAPRGANFTVQNSDFLMSLGARLDNVLCGYSHKNFARAARKVMVDIDPAEIRKMKTPIDVPVCADVADFLVEFRRQWGTRRAKDCGPWTARVSEWKTRWPTVLPEHRARTGPVSIYALSDVLSELLAEGETFVNGSSGSGIEIFLHAFRIKEGQRFLHTTALGAMGYAIPMAIGACLANGRKRLAVVDGDGGFQFNVQELETVRRLDLPIKFFVLDNQGYASIRASQKGYFSRLTGADFTSGLSLPDLARVADCWQIPFTRIDDQRALKERVRAVLDAPGPAICNVTVIPDEDRLPRITSRILPDGSMRSTPLEDMLPLLDREEFRANMLIDPPEDDL
jgi:acetolactate synthase-1/2/3 large subunit